MTARRLPETEIEARLAAAVAPVMVTIGSQEFGARLAQFLRERAPSDSHLELVYHGRYPPRVLFDDLDPRDQKALYGRYFDGAYLFSPFYLRWRAAPATSALYRLQEIAPEGFFESVYYTDYYARSGLVDELGYVIPIGVETAVLVSLGRTAQSRVYSDEERQRLLAVQALVDSAVTRHVALTNTPAKHLQKQLADALARFGSRVLTERERSVVNLMLRGHSSKSCARELGISPTTERVHRRNIYAKLRISSQAELYNLFFDALSADDLPAGQDPLAHRLASHQ